MKFPHGQGYGPDWQIIRSLFRFGLPSGIQGIAMNVGGTLMLAFIGSVAQGPAAQAAFAIGYSQLFSLITWTSVGLMGAAAAVAGQNLGAKQPERADAAVHVAARFGDGWARRSSALFFLFFPRQLLGVFGMNDPAVLEIGDAAAARAERVGAVHHDRADVHGRSAGDGRHEGPALHLDRVADHRAVRHLLRDQGDGHAAADRHLDRDPDRARDALRVERAAVQSGQVAQHRGGRSLTAPRHRDRSGFNSEETQKTQSGASRRRRRTQKPPRSSSRPRTGAV